MLRLDNKALNDRLQNPDEIHEAISVYNKFDLIGNKFYNLFKLKSFHRYLKNVFHIHIFPVIKILKAMSYWLMSI